MTNTEADAVKSAPGKKAAVKDAKSVPGSKPRKPARKAVAKAPRKLGKPEGSTVYNFQPRIQGSAKTMETLMTQKKNQYDKIAHDAAAAQKDQMEALMRSGNIAAKGMEDILKTCMHLAQTTAEKNAQAFKSLIGCRTLNEFTEAQNRVAQSNFDDFMTGTTRLSELTVKLATDVFEPINDQITRSMKMATDVMAA